MGLAGRALGVDDPTFLHRPAVQLVLLVSIVSSLGSVASPALPAMGSALGVSAGRIGLVFSAFTLPGILILPWIGIVADRWGRRPPVVVGLLLFGIAGFAVGLVSEFWLVLLLRGIQGVGYAAFNVLTVALLGDLLEGTEETAAQGVRATLNKLTGFAGPVFAGLLAGIAWNYPFFLYGLAVPVGLIFLARYGAEPGRSRSERRTPPRQQLASLANVITRPFVGAVLAAGFFRMFLKYALYAFIALAVVEGYGGTAAVAGLYVGLYSLTGALVSTQAARVTGRIGSASTLAVGFVVASAAFLAVPLARDLTLLGWLVVVHGIGEGLINPVHKSLLTGVAGWDQRASIVASNGVVQSIGRTVTPVLLAPLLVVGGGYSLLFAVAGGVTLVATIAAVLAIRLGAVGRERS